MSSNESGPRPRQVTIGGWVIAVASALLMVTVFDTMSQLHSVDTRESLTKALTTGSLKELGISVDDALTAIRGALFVAGAAAAVTAILGIFVLQRHTVARIVLTVAAVPVVLTAPVSGGLLGVVVGAGTALLWTRPARDWFAGRPVTRPTAERAAFSWPPSKPATRTDRADVPDVPRVEAPRPVVEQSAPAHPPPPTHGWGQTSSVPVTWAPAYPSAPTRTPGQVRAACILTWVFSLLTGGLYVMVLAAIAVDRQAVLDLLRDNASVQDTSLSDSELVGLLVAVSAIVILWCLAASVLAFLTWRRQAWAWILLLVSVGFASLLELFAIPFSLLNLAACIVAFVLLLRPPVREWFRRGGAPTMPSGPVWPPPGGHQPPPPEPPSGKPPVW